MAQTVRTLATTSRPRVGWCSIVLMVILLAPVISAAGSDPLRYQTGVRNSNSRGLAEKQLLAVLKSLRHKTGLPGLAFDSDGFLQLGDETNFSGGSATARALLVAAISSDFAFDLETHNRSQIVAFARLGSPISFQSLKTKAQIEVLPIEIDFTDFDRLRGDRQVISSFDLGMVLLHELAHGVLRLHDVSSDADGLGDCESHINQIRRELNLPERQRYFAQLSERPSSVSGAIRPHAELLFNRATPATGAPGRAKRELFVLWWEAELVGQLRNHNLPSKARAGTVTMQ